jgi:hypothetical protein
MKMSRQSSQSPRSSVTCPAKGSIWPIGHRTCEEMAARAIKRPVNGGEAGGSAGYCERAALKGFGLASQACDGGPISLALGRKASAILLAARSAAACTGSGAR